VVRHPGASEPRARMAYTVLSTLFTWLVEKHMGVDKPWRVHDLRRNFSTGLSDVLHIDPHVIEACLNHASAKTTVAATYNTSTYRDQRKVALERWASHVESSVSGKAAKVIQFERA
jgi:integrase